MMKKVMILLLLVTVLSLTACAPRYRGNWGCCGWGPGWGWHHGYYQGGW